MAKFEEGQKVRIASTENGLYVGQEHEVIHVGEDSEGEDHYIVEVDMAEPYRTLNLSEGGSGKANAGFHEHNLEEV